MANLFAIHSVGNSLATYLRNSYPAELRAAHACTFSLFSSGEMNTPDEAGGAVLSLFLYRITINQHLRNAHRAAGPNAIDVPLSVDLHYLMTMWSSSAVDEQVVMAWAMRQLHHLPVLDNSALSPEAGWGTGDVVQIIPAELSNEDIMRIWDALEPPYRLSVSYIARVVRIDPDHEQEARPVVATRFSSTDREAMP